MKFTSSTDLTKQIVKRKVKERMIKLPAVTKRRLYCIRLWARPRGCFFLSCFATFGVCPLTFPARAREPCTLPAFQISIHRVHSLFTNTEIETNFIGIESNNNNQLTHGEDEFVRFSLSRLIRFAAAALGLNPRNSNQKCLIYLYWQG